ncbi:gibberellin-regulated 1-like [Olea europaea subsp. europaea]|uniref:Gibberellin-regulated 1-like n=1 Tax=Olea europaea subsp. europaea TaxID=158383 RepID=A0A8S0TAR1_OLEEU|nr:gibberellin-regulated 1-like [Olea europaea subsp. europaea]
MYILFLYTYIFVGYLYVCADCGKECSRRCRLSSRPRLCDRACGTCCNRCNCVPPGTAGNQEICPCYANMTTHGGRKKCP